jgi:hypothetical protein
MAITAHIARSPSRGAVMSRIFHPRTVLERAAHAAARRAVRVGRVRSVRGAVSMPGSRQRAALH